MVQTQILALISAVDADRTRLALESIALRQGTPRAQAQREASQDRAKIEDSDRIFWILMRRLLDTWRDMLMIVGPETVIQWHRKRGIEGLEVLLATQVAASQATHRSTPRSSN